MVAIAHWLNVWTSVSEVPSQILVPDRRTRLVYRCLPIKDLSRMPNFCHFVCQEKQAGTNHEATAVRHMIGARESRVGMSRDTCRLVRAGSRRYSKVNVPDSFSLAGVPCLGAKEWCAICRLSAKIQVASQREQTIKRDKNEQARVEERPRIESDHTVVSVVFCRNNSCMVHAFVCICKSCLVYIVQK